MLEALAGLINIQAEYSITAPEPLNKQTDFNDWEIKIFVWEVSQKTVNKEIKIVRDNMWEVIANHAYGNKLFYNAFYEDIDKRNQCYRYTLKLWHYKG